MLIFLIISGCLLWVIPGAYNIPENGYASLSSFFSIAPILLLFLIPALSMRSFSEEKRMHTLTVLKSRPVSMQTVLFAKIAALFITALITLLPTLIYIICIYRYGNPVGNIDLGAVAASYAGLLFLILAFICLSVFASYITSNQVIALITGMALCVFFYFGFDLIGLDSLSFSFHYKSVQRGLIESRDLFYFLLISVLSCYAVKKQGVVVGIFFLFCLSGLIFNFRFDWTKDKRYTIHPVSKELLKKLDAPLNIEVYLTGNLNPGFTRLQESTLNLLSDFNKFSSQKIEYETVDPYRQGKDFMAQLNEEGIKGVSVNERNSAGQITQNIIFPYALVKQKDLRVPVPLLVNQMGRSGEENLNLSREMLEYQLIHAIRLVTQKESKKIVFLEGHGELPEKAVSEITDYLSYEFTIDRGILSGRPGELDNYDLVIVAGPQLPFSEADKFVLDQYLMQGGRLLWFVNGVKLHSYEELAQQGETLCLSNDLNLSDLFFTYGIRIHPAVLQDVQSLPIPVVSGDESNTDYISKPWYYSALLTPNSAFEITKGLSWVKAGFAGVLSVLKNPSGQEESFSEVLLSSSQQAHTVAVPAMISLTETDRKPDKNYFNESHLPVAVLLHPPFTSGFKNRNSFFAPAGYPFLSESNRQARMIVVASEDMIANPLGYDSYSQTQFANKEFILNCADYLTDNAGISALKNKSLQIQLLDKQKLQQDRNQLLFVNVILPPLVLLVLFTVLSIARKRKYSRYGY
jgi:ABC-2 type transport system permease protein